MEDSLRGLHTTLTTAISAAATLSPPIINNIQEFIAIQLEPEPSVRIRDESTVNGVVIGLLSSFGSAILIAFIFLVVYFFRYTSNGRILLDRMGRPGEYDDEQAFAREEAEALEEMDDLQRTEYLRAKGVWFSFRPRILVFEGLQSLDQMASIEFADWITILDVRYRIEY